MWTSTAWSSLLRLTCCFLPSFLTCSFESQGWQEDLLACTVVLIGPWFSHNHMRIGEGGVDGISSKCFSHSLSTFFQFLWFSKWLNAFWWFFFSSLLRFESVSDFTSELEDSDDPTAYVTNLTYYHLVPFETDILDWGCSGMQSASLQPTSSSIGSAISGIAALWIRLRRPTAGQLQQEHHKAGFKSVVLCCVLWRHLVRRYLLCCWQQTHFLWKQGSRGFLRIKEISAMSMGIATLMQLSEACPVAGTIHPCSLWCKLSSTFRIPPETSSDGVTTLFMLCKHEDKQTSWTLSVPPAVA